MEEESIFKNAVLFLLHFSSDTREMCPHPPHGMSQWYGHQWRRKVILRIYQRLYEKRGLLEINDTTFSLFREIELGMQDRLSTVLKSSTVERD